VGFSRLDAGLRSPLVNLSQACGTCHKLPEEELHTRVAIIYDRTAGLLRRSEEALLDAINAIVEARQAGSSDEVLKEALQYHRSAQLRWDLVSSENSTGFHSPQESARVLAEAIDLAWRAELKARQIMRR
jgi:nitrite reductase (cytochrome c-552)